MPAASLPKSKDRSSLFKDGENNNEENGLMATGQDKKDQMLEKLKEIKKNMAANLEIQQKQVL